MTSIECATAVRLWHSGPIGSKAIGRAGGAQHMTEVVFKQIEDGVAVITLNRPDRLNAWTAEMEHAYFGMLEECGSSAEVRVIVVTGAGRGFCAGADMHDLQAMGDGSIEAAAHAQERRAQSFPQSIPKPIIAAINGACAGIGPARALDLLLSGRVVLAQEAQELGMVNRVIQPDGLLEQTLDYARDLAVSCSPASMATMKRQVYGDLQRTLPDALQEADGLMLASFAAADFQEGVASFLARRDPRFAALGA